MKDVMSRERLTLTIHRSFDTGQFDYVRYKDLVSTSNVPFVRASGDQRVIVSAANWTSGMP